MEHPATILIVDDSVQVLHLVRSILQREGFESRTAESGEQALELASANHFDLVIMDAMMPGLSGFEACDELKRMPQHADTPVLFLTGMTDLRTYQQAIDVGGDDLLGKPINRAGLLIRVRSLLRLAELRTSRERHVRRLEEQARELQRLERQRTELVDYLLNDLEPPLAALQRWVGRLKSAGSESAEVTQAADELGHEAGVLSRLVSNLALVAPEPGAGLVANRHPLDLATLIDEVCARARSSVERRGLALQVAIDPAAKARRIEADAELLRPALENLLDHARRFCESGDRIEVALAVVSDQAVALRVSDPGRGSDEEQTRSMREAAFSGSLPRGRGLGLEYCRAVAEAHGGSLDIHPEQDGLRAQILLPAALA